MLFGFSVLFLVLAASTIGITETIAGQRESCSNEGEEVKLGNFKCFKCKCQNGFVECEPENCPVIDDCYMLEERPRNGCCQKCKDCFYRGRRFPSGSEWSDPEDSCSTFQCEAGVITETIQECYTPCSKTIPPRPGQCCPTCLNCYLNGQQVLEGREVTLTEDPCLKCHCSNKKLTCAKKACPVLQCPVSTQIRIPGECCPRCSKKREIMQVPGKCILGKGFHSNGKHFAADRCTSCECVNGTSICHRNTCPVLECSPEYQKVNPGDCCPHCPPVAEVRSTCTYHNQTFQNEETWILGPCRSCKCHSGEIRCAQTKCPKVKCRPNEISITPEGQCCTRCVESAGICTVFGDPHYKTFDGKHFSFQGSCKYQLAADCHDHTFAIRVTNDGRLKNSTTRTRTVTLKIRGIRVNLGQKFRVKVNGSRVSVPFNLKSILKIDQSAEAIFLTTEIGLQIEWDGRSFLQIQVPPTYKNKLCGLCGNFNGISRDDLTSREGINCSDAKIWKFANSWKVGGQKTCNKRRLIRPQTCKIHSQLSLCSPLLESTTFGGCDSHINPHNYYEACKQDMCDCASQTCYCESFAAYAHECGRLGVSVPNWRRITNCQFEPTHNKNQDHSATMKKTLHKTEEKQQSERLRKKQRRPDFFTRHVPKALLIPKHQERTPPPLQ